MGREQHDAGLLQRQSCEVPAPVLSVQPSAAAEAAVAFTDVSWRDTPLPQLPFLWMALDGEGRPVERQMFPQWVKCTGRLQNTDECSKCC